MGDCEWTSESLVSFLTCLCSWKRKKPLSLQLDKCKTNFSDFKFPTKNLQPVLSELNFSDNVFSSDTFQQFLSFLDTQSPVLSENSIHLMYLSLSRCFPYETEKCMKMLIDFFSKRDIWGLELLDIFSKWNNSIFCFFLEQLSVIDGLVSINLIGNVFDSKSIQLLQKFIQKSQTIAEIGIDQTQIIDLEQLTNFYDSVLTSSHILAMKQPIQDIISIKENTDVSNLNSLLQEKRRMSTIVQRTELFLSLFGSYDIQIVSPISNEPNDFSLSNPLLDSNFSNPLKSIFTSQIQSDFDDSIDPLAHLVTEYVVFTGRIGIGPATAPPTEPPTSSFLLPSIFTTISYEDEMDYDQIDFEKLSVELAQNLSKNNKMNSNLSTLPKWAHYPNVLTVPKVPK